MVFAALPAVITISSLGERRSDWLTPGIVQRLKRGRCNIRITTGSRSASQAIKRSSSAGLGLRSCRTCVNRFGIQLGFMRRRQFITAAPLLATAASAAPPRTSRWTVITIGNLSRNRYWGESDAKPARGAICTCTLISGDGFHLLVDPSLAKADDMTSELDRRTGLKPDDISAVFVTHEHGDHFAGVEHFQKAEWFAAAPVARILNGIKKLSRNVEPAPKTLFGAVEVIPTPGHTHSHHSLRFDCEGRSIVAAGDSVATRDFWRERRSYYNAVDAALAAKTMDRLASLAGIVIPGHDNYFTV